MFCTGGIRCEKATAYVRSLGFDEVFHLKGGILKYLEKVPASESLWQGECFVFDERVSVTHGLAEGEAELCRACRRPLTPAERRSPKYREGISCARCYGERSDDDRARYAERQRQVELAPPRRCQADRRLRPSAAKSRAARHCNVADGLPNSCGLNEPAPGLAGGNLEAINVRSQEAAQRSARLAQFPAPARRCATGPARRRRWPRTIRWPPARWWPCCSAPSTGRPVTGSALKLGGLAAIGGLAYKAYQNYQNGGKPPIRDGRAGAGIAAAARRHRLPPSQAPQGEAEFALTLMRAMIAAAKADGHIDDEERKKIADRLALPASATTPSSSSWRRWRRRSIGELVEAAQTEEQKVELYTASRLAIDPNSRAERGYLDLLAGRLRLPDALVDHVEATVSAAKTAALRCRPVPCRQLALVGARRSALPASPRPDDLGVDARPGRRRRSPRGTAGGRRSGDWPGRAPSPMRRSCRASLPCRPADRRRAIARTPSTSMLNAVEPDCFSGRRSKSGRNDPNISPNSAGLASAKST